MGELGYTASVVSRFFLGTDVWLLSFGLCLLYGLADLGLRSPLPVLYFFFLCGSDGFPNDVLDERVLDWRRSRTYRCVSCAVHRTSLLKFLGVSHACSAILVPVVMMNESVVNTKSKKQARKDRRSRFISRSMALTSSVSLLKTGARPSVSRCSFVVGGSCLLRYQQRGSVHD